MGRLNQCFNKNTLRYLIAGLALTMTMAMLNAQNNPPTSKLDTLAVAVENELIPTDSIDLTDTVKYEPQLHHGVDLRSPKKALLYSAILPGMGQAYNRKYWKIPIVYGAFAGVGYAAYFNQREYKRFKQLYIDEIDKVPHEFSGRINAANLRRIRDDYRKNMELSYIGLVAVYGLNLLDAFVDAHLKTFDVSDDLSIRIAPRAVHHQGFNGRHSASPGMTVSFLLH